MSRLIDHRAPDRSARRRLLDLAVSLTALIAFPAPAAQVRHLPIATISSAQNLTAADVNTIVAQAAQEASRRGARATIAVVDRDGNVLAVYRMAGANIGVAGHSGLRDVLIAANSHGPNAGLNGVMILDTAAAISKAITGAYLSSSANAFSTRTASQIIQDHFNPGQQNAPSGPLYGVQFSQLPCSDVNRRSALVDPNAMTLGPKRSPFGLAGDPGGFPLYKDGQNVGGLGVLADGVYGIDENIANVDHDSDEIIALAGTVGYQPATTIRADHIAVNGLTLRYSDATAQDFASNPALAHNFNLFAAGQLIDVIGYYQAAQGFIRGTVHGTFASGLQPDRSGAFGPSAPLVMANADGSVRYPPRAGHVAQGLSATEVSAILRSAYETSLITRGAIREPLGKAAAVSISVVDGNGEILGSVTNPDAPVFGIDVSVQKARTALLMSGTMIQPVLSVGTFQKYLAAARSFFGPSILNGTVAFSARSIGNLSRDTYPDGIGNTPSGPFGISPTLTTPFADGLQEELIFPDILAHAQYVSGSGSDVGAACTRGVVPAGPNTTLGQPVLADGLQIFPGGFPIYRGGRLIGGVGVSGDGVSQDDMISFLGLYQAGVSLGTGVGHAPLSIRASNLVAHNARPVYISCPTAPFLNSNSQDACSNK